mmetsp:Transcript_129258/g.359973  ORF Transcript_129258/g.359973 Transcript_129258/m.359973 type:complete len:166 (+) Transcript_129258:63-560(+)
MCSCGRMRAEAVVTLERHSRAEVYRAVAEIRRWGEWNSTFEVVKVYGEPAEAPGAAVPDGTRFRIRSWWADGSADESEEQMVEQVPEQRLQWRFAGAPRWLLAGDHYLTFEDAAGGGVLVRSWEDFAGPAVPLLRCLGIQRKVSQGFADFLHALQRHLDTGDARQ